MLPCTTKNRILQLLITLENMFQINSKLQAGFKNTTLFPVVYLEHMSTDTLGVGRSHLGWMNF
jgi:Cft2 family RNA processing exonuclease